MDSAPNDPEALRAFYQTSSQENSSYGCGIALLFLLAGAVTIGLILGGLSSDAKNANWFSGPSVPTPWGTLWLIILAVWIVAITLFVLIERRHSERQRSRFDQFQRAQEEKFRALTLSNIDSMNGIEFEQYLQRILRAQGFDVRITKGSGDLGVDLIASRSNDSIAIQVKRYGSKISRRAVSDAVAGMRHYSCSRAMVITNNYFTPGAVQLAASNNCTLVDRKMLADWITHYQSSSAGAEQSIIILTCSQCGQRLRVPRMSDRLRIHCPTCSNSFLSHQ